MKKYTVDFDLAYDGGGQRFSQSYRTKPGMYLSVFRQKYISSWGGTAKLRAPGSLDGYPPTEKWSRPTLLD